MRNKRMVRIRSLSAVFLLCLLAVCGCGRDVFTDGGKESPSSARKQKVTLITKSTNSAFWKSVYSGASAASTEYNMELLFEGPDSEEDYETQNEMIRQAVKDNTDAIVFSAVDYEANAEAIDEAAEAGVEIIVIDSNVNSQEVSCHIGTDNYEAGRTAGKAALACEEDVLNIGIVNFDKTTENGQSRERGFRDTVTGDDRSVIVESLNVLSSVDVAREETKRMLEEHPEINVIATFNEWTSLGVGAAIKELKAAGRTEVVAFDSNVICVDMLETGEVDALVVQNPYAMGYLGVENAYRLINGHSIKTSDIDTSVKLVTKDNMYSDECQRMLFAFDQEH